MREPFLDQPLLWHPDSPATGPARVLFRGGLRLAAPAGQTAWWVPASQRFRLWVDGRELARGPSRADRGEWGVVPVDAGPLAAGEHVVAVEVTHWGPHAGKGQVGGPGFLLFAGAEGTWRCTVDASRSPLLEPGRHRLSGHRAIGAGERFEAALHPWGWEQPGFDDASWIAPRATREHPGNPWGNRSADLALVREPLPPLRRTAWPWRTPELPRTIGPHRMESRVLDAGVVLNAVPTVRWSGGRGATVRLTWCEAPVHPEAGKGHRDVTAGCVFPGQEDLLLPDGGAARAWKPPWIRSFRYLHLEVATAEEPLAWEGVTLERESFPLEARLETEIEDPDGRPWGRLREASLDTALACSHETFFDCPAWEQAQFPGDVRIQARHHYVLAGEDRLAWKAIRDLGAATVPGGLLRSHAPSSFRQVIATYSLQWIGLLDDWRVYRGRPEAVARFVPQARAIAEWFLARRRSDGLLGWIAEPLFVDWARGFEAGCAPQGPDGGSSAATALLAESCAMLARLETFAGRPPFAAEWSREAESLRAALEQCWNKQRGLLTDWPGAPTCSVHAQVQATLAGLWPAERAAAVLARALGDGSVTQPGTLYYRAHVAAAWRRAGHPEGVWSLLPAWFRLLDGTGLTTWPETDGPQPRSDCHGWGNLPEIELAHAILGCSPDPAHDGWSRNLLQPALGNLTRVRGTVPHPLGRMAIEIARRDGGLEITLDCPVETLVVPTGERLPPGRHELRLPG